MIPSMELRKQAIASIQTKHFHCQGGTVYAALVAKEWRPSLIRLIVALQTISDYLDNLCDRSTSMDGAHFHQLHQAMLDAVDPKRSIQDYYALGTEREDGGYLTTLVESCRQMIALLPSYELVQEQVTQQVNNYVHLQVYKHVERSQREALLLKWWQRYQPIYPQLYWQEFAAATGSTLGMFALFAKATNPSLATREVEELCNAYFPAITGLHILLDYLIDQEEDRKGGDLNFVHYYANPREIIERLRLFVQEAKKKAKQIHPFHRLIVDGLLAIYLSDRKVAGQKEVAQVARQLLSEAGWRTRYFAWQGKLIRQLTHS